ncbi:MAG TPA: DUF4019 domain-containing protein [Rhizomicrobium sp.]|jgi:hypothetical protein|nr:DUF4019 domain-containing protein [Rhizomicrobium sp.]
MLAKAIVTALLVLTVSAPAAAPALAQAARATAATPAPADRARQWLTLVDDKNYQQSWAESGAAFKARHKPEDWAKSAGALRTPLGAMSSRDLKSIDASRSNIAVIRFDTVFAHKAASVETLTLTFQNGSWAVTEYAIE